ncbi:MAG: peptide chain release factor N(5)-glutamine methyltransferase [Bacteroidales bacterium]
MTIQDVKIEFQSKLNNIYSEKECKSFCNLLLEYIGFSQSTCVISPHVKLSDNHVKLCSDVIARLQKQEPIQYILGYADFYGLQFHVDSSVLIPRQETELLVHTIIKKHASRSEVILDLCTGSGCIAVALAYNLFRAQVYALDVSADALLCAERNAQKHNTSVRSLHNDLLSADVVDVLPECSVIVSNPPYVRQSEKEYMHKNVLDYEPDLALFVSDTHPLLFYDAIADVGQVQLIRNGHLYCEINEALGKDVVQLFKHKGYKEVQLIPDLHEKNRFVHALK